MKLTRDTLLIDYSNGGLPVSEILSLWKRDGRPSFKAIDILAQAKSCLDQVGLAAPLPTSLFELFPLSSTLRHHGIRRVLFVPGEDWFGLNFTLRSAIDNGFQAYLLLSEPTDVCGEASEFRGLLDIVTLAEARRELALDSAMS